MHLPLAKNAPTARTPKMVKIARLKCATMAVRTPTRLINTRKPAGFALTSKLLSVYDTFEEGLPARVALFFRPVFDSAQTRPRI